MKIKLFAIVAVLGILLASPAFAQESSDEFDATAPEQAEPEQFYKAKVLETYTKDQEVAPEYFEKVEMAKVRILDGPDKGREFEARNLFLYQYSQTDKVNPGDTVVVSRITNADGNFFYIADKYRLNTLAILVVVFFLLAIAFARFKGFTSILGLCFSIFVLTVYIVPQILKGQNPLLVTVIGASVIALVAIYLAHGFNKRASIALFSTVATLGLSTLLAVIFVKASQLFGLGSEEAFFLQGVPNLDINLQGLLLGGIIIGTLGVLDDITASQAAAVDEISKADPSLSFKELYKRGSSVGHEHIAALINTLALAYAGASLPLFLLFTINEGQPLWVLLNSEFIAEEVVRTLVGSIALIFAVPITTLLASYFFQKDKQIKNNI